MTVSGPALLVALCSMVGACQKESAPTQPAPKPAEVVPDAAPAAEPWRVTGRLLGAVGDRAIVLREQIMSVDIESGEHRSAATTAAVDPVPDFDDYLPRLGETERDGLAVDRLPDMPVYVGGEVVVFMRGTEEAVTGVVGLDATTLEEAWSRELAYRRPLRSCATVEGLVLIPPVGQPSRFVDWLGGQRWLREFGEPDEEVTDFSCGEHVINVTLKSDKTRQRSFDGTTGDLTDASPPRVAPADPRVRQVGDEVVGPG